eukprot:6192811-Pleurochrysis_carterae.AAC.2
MLTTRAHAWHERPVEVEEVDDADNDAPARLEALEEVSKVARHERFGAALSTDAQRVGGELVLVAQRVAALADGGPLLLQAAEHLALFLLLVLRHHDRVLSLGGRHALLEYLARYVPWRALALRLEAHAAAGAVLARHLELGLECRQTLLARAVLLLVVPASRAASRAACRIAR